MTETDVIIVGAAPTGLMLAGELRRLGTRVLVLERLLEPRPVPKAGGVGGQLLRFLDYRGLTERFEAASGKPRPTPRFPFGGLHVDLTQLTDNPMEALLLPQPDLERLLEVIAVELGAEIRRGHELAGLTQDDDSVTADVRGPEGPYRVTARYLVGCDGVGSPVRSMAGIAFPGVTYPEVNRLGHFAMPDSVTLRDDGDYEIPGIGHVSAGYTQTDRGVFAISSYTPDDLGLYTNEEEERSYNDAEPMTVAEFQESIRRVLGADIPLVEPTRLTRFTYGARQVDRYRAGRVLVAGDAAHQFPSGGVALTSGMLDTVNLAWKLAAEIDGWAPPGLLDTYHDERHLAGARTLLHTQAQVALRRGLDAAADALRQIVSELFLDEQAQRRVGEMIAGADIRYPMPGSDRHGLVGTFAPDLALRTDRGTTSVAELIRAARPILLVLADRQDVREAVRGWEDRVDVHTAETDDRPADALLIRPDAHIAWAATIDEPADTAALTLREALSYWFGAPVSRPRG
ncbi:FAD-dependent monooxygenase [Mycobacterium sp. AZCC_0083]|uniref:FAD-dependent monooxygenase n=1 Tax=Mycobacterium sp. AZCC_0083 TaxID=2735882 RepID=UPI0017A95863|nr:FAD-dependent monooxygenase [Mycobacterium sp. AZCC_0083]MBB5166024.1 2-polyprenyl-6-methoxyphenol hydroxylase-like FAD-dependent oxidoreductase [Mycobacterium sp. AZCC_0083]